MQLSQWPLEIVCVCVCVGGGGGGGVFIAVQLQHFSVLNVRFVYIHYTSILKILRIKEGI